MIFYTYLAHTWVLAAQNKQLDLIVVIWYPFHVHAFFVYAFLFCWSCYLFKGKLLKQAYAYESVLITGLWQDSTVTWINQPAQLIYCSSK